MLPLGEPGHDLPRACSSGVAAGPAPSRARGGPPCRSAREGAAAKASVASRSEDGRRARVREGSRPPARARKAGMAGTAAAPARAGTAAVAERFSVSLSASPAGLGAGWISPPQVVGHVPGPLVALGGVLLEGPGEDRSSPGGRSSTYCSGRREVVVDDAVADHRQVLALERLVAGEHLVEHDAQREDVGAVVDLLALDLLRAPCSSACRGAAPPGSGSRCRAGRCRSR